MRHVLASFALWLSISNLVHAQSAPAPAVTQAATNLAVVTVSGVQPGPGLWKVSQGNHVLWILGTLSPLPQRMQWQSRQLEDVVSHSQQVLLTPAIKPKIDAGFFGKLFLLPSAMSARKNDDGKTLQQVLPPPLYARWEVLKQKYLGDDRGIERWRPIFAAQELYKKALKANDLSRSGGVQTNIDALAKKYGVAELPVELPVEIEHPHDAIKTFKTSGIDDTACFGHTLDAIEHDIPAMTERANAWATGDLDSLRHLPDSDRQGSCISAITDADFARKLGFADAPARLEAQWLAAARRALASNAQTFAILPISQLLASDGYMAKLKQAGYTVTSPDEDDAAPAASMSAPGQAGSGSP